MLAETRPIRCSPAEYLALARAAEYKNEYIDGMMVPMHSASRAHNLITVNVGADLNSQLRQRPHEVYASRLRVKARHNYVYPDASVTVDSLCEDEYDDTLLNPTVVIEVLSPSTEACDRGKKFAAYELIASLQEYLLITQDTVLVEHYVRQGDRWEFSRVSRSGDSVYLPSIDCALRINEIYDEVSVSGIGDD